MRWNVVHFILVSVRLKAINGIHSDLLVGTKMHSERKVTLNRGGVAHKIAADHSNPWGKLPTPAVKVTEYQYPHPFQFCLPNAMQL